MTTLKSGAKAKDPTYFGVETLVWTGVETNVGIMCACLPLLRPILNSLFPWFARRTAADTRPSFVSYGSAPIRTVNYQAGGSWSNCGTAQNVILSKVSSGGRESRGSSEAGIPNDPTYGIHVVRKVTSIENSIEDNGWERSRQDSQPASGNFML
jgi:hypothetical protein